MVRNGIKKKNKLTKAVRHVDSLSLTQRWRLRRATDGAAGTRFSVTNVKYVSCGAYFFS